MTSVLSCQGRELDLTQLAWLQQWIPDHADWSRKRLARALCEHWQWRNARGALKDFAARSFLLKLETQGLIALPPLQVHKRRAPRGVAPLEGWVEPPGPGARLRELQPLRVEVVRAATAGARRWAFYLDRYHYLGLRVVGENLGYLIQDGRGEDLACVLFGAPAWRCAVRDAFLQWGPQERRRGLTRLANNTRFLILPWVRVPQLASAVLGQVTRRIGADWQDKYGHGLQGLETFVDTTRYRSTCYRAANWRYLGATTGRSRQDRERRLQVAPKAVYFYSL